MKKMFLLATVVFLASCSGGKKTEETEKAEPLAFKTEKFEMKSAVNKPKVTEATLDVTLPVAEGDSVNTERINEKVFQTVKLIVAMDGDSTLNYNELFTNYIANYEKFVKEFPDFPSGWKVTIEGTVEYNTPDLVNIKLDSYTMMGGAHGNSNVYSFIFDPKTGNELSLDDIVTDKDSILSIAENTFREKYNIPAEGAINSTGLMFEDNVFALPKNVFVTDDGLQLFYNQYEIAAYAEGTKDITLPYDEIKKYLKVSLGK